MYLDSRPVDPPPSPTLNLLFREFSHLCTQASKLKSRPKMSEIMIENKLSSMLLSDLVIICDHSKCSKLCYLEIYVDIIKHDLNLIPI